MNNEYNIEDSKCMFCDSYEDPQIKPLSYEKLSSVISASEHRQNKVCKAIEKLRRCCCYCVPSYLSLDIYIKHKYQ